MNNSHSIIGTLHALIIYLHQLYFINTLANAFLVPESQYPSLFQWMFPHEAIYNL